MNKILESIRHRPGLSLGRHNGSFTCLEGYLSGYEVGFAAAKHGYGPEELLPQDFNKFVSEKFGERFPTPKGAGLIIAENTSSEREAFDLFFTLLEEYDQKHSGT